MSRLRDGKVLADFKLVFGRADRYGRRELRTTSAAKQLSGCEKLYFTKGTQEGGVVNEVPVKAALAVGKKS